MLPKNVCPACASETIFLFLDLRLPYQTSHELLKQVYTGKYQLVGRRNDVHQVANQIQVFFNAPEFKLEPIVTERNDLFDKLSESEPHYFTTISTYLACLYNLQVGFEVLRLFSLK